MADAKPVLIFDLWGTLVEQGVYSPVKQIKAIVKPNIPFKEYIKRMQTALLTKEFESMREGFEAVYQEFGIESSSKKLDDLVGMWNKNWLLAKLFEDTKEVLEELQKDYSLVLVANADTKSIQSVLDKFELTSFFDKLFISSEMGLIKSNSEFFTKVLEELQVDKENVTMVGDSMQSDIFPAQNVGLRAILVDRKGNRDFSPKITSLKNLRVAVEDN